MADDKIIRVKRPYNYTFIDNKLLEDVNISAKAKGIMCYILSLPDDWTLYASELKNHFTDGKDSIASGIEELVNAGYITKEKYRDDLGHFACAYYVYETSQNPDWYNPNRKSRCGKSETENPQLPNTKRLNTNKPFSANAEDTISPSEKVYQKEIDTDIESVINNKTENNNKELNSDNSSLGIQINNNNQDIDNKINSEKEMNSAHINNLPPQSDAMPSWALQEEPVKTKKIKKTKANKVEEPTPNAQIKELYKKGFEYLQKIGKIDSRLEVNAKGKIIDIRISALLKKFNVEQFKMVLREALTDKYIVDENYPFLLILSDNTFIKLYNQAIVKQPKPEEPKRHFEKSIYEYCPDCGIGYSVWGECIICGRKKPERIVDTSDVSKTMLRSE